MKDDGVIMASGLQGFRASGLQGFRDNIVDSLRGFAIILVVIGHIAGGFHRSNLPFMGGEFVHDYIYSFHMPLMFVISGYVHGVKEHFSSGQSYLYYLRKYAADIYLPCLFFSLMYWIPKYILTSSSVGTAEGLVHTDIGNLFRIPFFGFSAYWFLCTLFFVKMLHLLFERYIKRESLHSVFWLLVFICVNVFSGIIPSFFHQFRYGLYFHMGFMMKRHNLIPKNFSLGIILLLAGTACFCSSQFYGISNIFIRTGVSMCISLALFIIFYALDIKNGFLVTCGVCSMVIYCLHDWILSSSRVIYRFTGLSSSANIFMLFTLSFISALFIPLIIVWVYKHVKCLRWIEYIFYPGRYNSEKNPLP